MKKSTFQHLTSIFLSAICQADLHSGKPGLHLVFPERHRHRVGTSGTLVLNLCLEGPDHTEEVSADNDAADADADDGAPDVDADVDDAEADDADVAVADSEAADADAVGDVYVDL